MYFIIPSCKSVLSCMRIMKSSLAHTCTCYFMYNVKSHIWIYYFRLMMRQHITHSAVLWGCEYSNKQQQLISCLCKLTQHIITLKFTHHITLTSKVYHPFFCCLRLPLASPHKWAWRCSFLNNLIILVTPLTLWLVDCEAIHHMPRTGSRRDICNFTLITLLFN